MTLAMKQLHQTILLIQVLQYRGHCRRQQDRSETSPAVATQFQVLVVAVSTLWDVMRLKGQMETTLGFWIFNLRTKNGNETQMVVVDVLVA